MNSANTGKRSQREIFTDFLNALTAFNMYITEYLIKDLFNLLSQSLMVLDNAFIRNGFLRVSWIGQYKNGSYVAVIHSCIRSVFCDKEYHIPVSILYPISGKSEDAMRIFLIVSKSRFSPFHAHTVDSTINKQCKYVNQETNEIIIENLSAWSFVSKSNRNGCYNVQLWTFIHREMVLFQSFPFYRTTFPQFVHYMKCWLLRCYCKEWSEHKL